jgi:BON domain
VTARKLFPLAVAFGLWAAGPAVAQQKVSPMSAEEKARNQKLADEVAAKLKSSGAVPKGAKVDIRCVGGVVDLTGSVATQEQHNEILRALTNMKGLKRIESGIMVGDQPMVQRTGGQAEGGLAPPPASPPPRPMPSYSPTFTAAPPPPMPLGIKGGAVYTNEPVPMNGMPAMAPVDPAGPRLPPYAWPTYAPHNNYSRVAYPTSYPYNAFPYIGPFYPFPKVPLGWRKVVLEWEDGHWYYGKLSSPHDYWRVKFW